LRGLKVGSALLPDRLISHNFVVAAGGISAGVLGLVFQGITSHRFRPTDYGAIFAVLSVLATIAVPAGALTLVMAKEASRDQADARSDRSAVMMRVGNRWLLLAGAICALLIILASRKLGAFFSASPSLFVVAALGIPFILALPVLLGELQGEQRFVAFSILTSGQAGLRLVAAFALGWFFGPIGVLAGVSLATGLTYVMARGIIGRRSSDTRASVEWGRVLRYLGVVLSGTLGLALLLGNDVLLVKHFFKEEPAGQYAVIAALGRGIFWGATGVAVVLFPKLVFRDFRNAKSANLVFGSLVFVALGGIAGMLVLLAWSRQIVVAFGGAKYLNAAVYLPWYAVGMTLLGAAYVLVTTYQSRGDARFLLVLIPVSVLEPGLIIRFHSDLLQVVQVMDLSMLVLVLGLSGLYLLSRSRWHPTAEGRSFTSNGMRLSETVAREAASVVPPANMPVCVEASAVSLEAPENKESNEPRLHAMTLIIAAGKPDDALVQKVEQFQGATSADTEIIVACDVPSQKSPPGVSVVVTGPVSRGDRLDLACESAAGDMRWA
jgi:O-antigen/teichoic acid export membrane protein